MTADEIQARVKEIIDQTDAAPFLFVGTGMSKRRAGHTWAVG